MLGLPGKPYHLEFTHRVGGSPCPAPTHDNLLVLYISDGEAITIMADRLSAMGYPQVLAENPYWTQHGAITVADPDGWRVVLAPSTGI